MPEEFTINDIVYYNIPGGRPTVDAHPNKVPLILYNKPLEDIMQFGDEQRAAGRKPCVIIPSPSLGGAYENAWNGHADPSGLLDNIAAHIDCYIVDFMNTVEPELPSVWQDTAPYPQYIFWEKANQELWFRGSHQQFINMFGFDPEDESEQPGGNSTNPTLTSSELTITHKGSIDVNIVNQG